MLTLQRIHQAGLQMSRHAEQVPGEVMAIPIPYEFGAGIDGVDRAHGLIVNVH